MLKRLAVFAGAGVVGGALALAGPAQAVDLEPLVSEPISVNVEKTAGQNGCGILTFTTAVNTKRTVPPNARLVVFDGVDVNTAAIGDPLPIGPFTTTEVLWRVFGGGERDFDYPLWNTYGDPGFNAEVTAYGAEHGWSWTIAGPDDPNPFVTWEKLFVEPCVTPEEPAVEQYDCATDGNAGELVIPDQPGVMYSHTSGPVKAGDHKVTAQPADGYTFPTEAQTEWELTVNAVDECATPTTTTETPDPTGLPDTSGVKTLPTLLGGAALLLILGAAALTFARRRRPASPE